MSEDEIPRQLSKERIFWGVLFFAIVAIFAFAFIGYEKKTGETRSIYSIEGRILLNQMEETNILRNEDLNFDEWLEVHNFHLSQHYTILLEYGLPEMSSAVFKQEKCLSDLFYFAAKGDTNSQEEVAGKCNELGREIDSYLLEHLREKMKGVQK